MVSIVGVRFRNAGKLYFFDPGNVWPSPGDYVVVDTSRGMEIGEAVTEVHEVPEEGLTLPLKSVLRIATAADLDQEQANRKAAKEAHAVCLRKIQEHQLDMKLVDTQFTLDNTKLIFYFTANGRVDFRSLVKDLAGVFHLRIELRQIGVRDEAKMLGGLGPCGRPICCGAFLGDFQPVSIRMAKDQGLSLNPTKISGICGRLMCCLKYEQDGYEFTRRLMPRVGKTVESPDGPGVVTDLNIIKETVTLRISKGDGFETKDYTLEALRELNPALRQKAEASAAEGDEPAETVPPEARAQAEEGPQRQEERKPGGFRENRRERPPREARAPKAHGPRSTAPDEISPKPGAQSRASQPKQSETSAPAAVPPENAPAREEPKQPARPSWRDAVSQAMKAAEGKANTD